jgi:hypothetical protein
MIFTSAGIGLEYKRLEWNRDRLGYNKESIESARS